MIDRLNLRVGEWVEVRDVAEILATLDDRQSLDGLPFMPEMLQYCGKRFRVYKSAHKTCDTIESYSIRRMTDTVHLEGLRCDGSAHGGCQATCLLFWKEAWLRRALSEQSSPARTSVPEPEAGLETLYRSTHLPAAAGEQECYRCQATELLNATKEVKRRDRWNPLYYLRDLTSGNVRFMDLIRYGAFAAFNAFMLRWRGRRYPHVVGLAGDKTPTANLNLQPGELVQVRSKDEIMRTLNAQQRNRGLFFDVEMVPFCEKGTFKVLGRVEKIIHEKTGRMTKLPNACLILDGATCGGYLSYCRMFCPRSTYPYWREIWLKRVEPSAASDRAGANS